MAGQPPPRALHMTSARALHTRMRIYADICKWLDEVEMVLYVLKNWFPGQGSAVCIFGICSRYAQCRTPYAAPYAHMQPYADRTQ